MSRAVHLIILSIFLLLTVLSCSKPPSEPPPPTTSTEFVASLSSFADYKNWTLDGEYLTDNGLEYNRIYYNKASEVNRTSGEYPIGTIIVQEINSSENHDSVLKYRIMVKRGGSFNPDGRGWEWFLVGRNISTDLIQRGGNEVTVTGSINGTKCYTCHAPKNDLVFNRF
jgi:hypothetical protein